MDRTVIKMALAERRAVAAVDTDEDESDDPAFLQGLGERQEDFAEALLDIVSDQGKWGQDDGPDGANYFPDSPFEDSDSECDDCIFYQQSGTMTGTCRVVSGTIDAEGWCAFFVREPGADTDENVDTPDPRVAGY